MNSQSRVHAALKREPTDRVPIWMWFHPDTAKRLAARFAISLSRLADVMGDDVRQTWVGNNYAMEGIVHDNPGDTHTDRWGIRWVKYGAFNQIEKSPLENIFAMYAAAGVSREEILDRAAEFRARA
jgi:hypothetical protein